MISTTDLVMAIVSIGIGSFLTTRMGPRRASVLIYTTYAMLALYVLYGQPLRIASAVIIGMSAVWSMHDTLTSICTNPLRMQLSDPQVAATQFTIYNSLSNLPVSFGATLFAVLGGTREMTNVLWVAVVLLLSGAAVYGLMTAGSRHIEAEAVPTVD
jgi:predicted MFS family arabinose efflux permease